MKAHEWIDYAKKQIGVGSDYAIAKRLGITQSAISRLRAKDSTLRDDTSIKLAYIAGIDPAIVLLDQARERTTNECVRDVWDRLAGVLSYK